MKKVFLAKIKTCILTAVFVSGLSLSSCDNFMDGGDFKDKLNADIAYAEAKNCAFVVSSDTTMGSFLSSGEKSCKEGYTTELQFTVNSDSYIFKTLEAVKSTDPSVSLSDCVQFTILDKNDKTGVYKIQLKILKAQEGMLIRPVCSELPRVVSYTPQGTDPQFANTPILITFNMPMEDLNVSASETLFTYDNISLLYTDSARNNVDMRDYFDEPVFDSQKKVLKIVPKAKKIEEFITEKKTGFIDVSIYFSDDIKIPVTDIGSFPIKQNDSGICVRYKAETEKNAPSMVDFFVTRHKISLDTALSLDDDKKFSLAAINLSDENLPEETVLKNRTTNGTLYIYGRYFDEQSGVNDVKVTTRFYASDGSFSEPWETIFTSDNAEFYTDSDGNTSFAIKIEDTEPGYPCVLEVIVRDSCENVSEAKNFTAFVPCYGEFNGESFNYLNNMPDYTTGTMTIEQYSSELKNVKIYPSDFVVYSGVLYPAEELAIYCEYTDKTGTIKNEQFAFNEGEKPHWNCLLNVDDVSDLSVKITVYDDETVYDQRTFAFPSKSAYKLNYVDNRLHYDEPNYQIVIVGEPDNRVFALNISSDTAYVQDIEYPLSGYDCIDLYISNTYYFETYNQYGLYGEVDSWDAVLAAKDTTVPSVVIKDVIVDTSSWRTNGGIVNIIITLSDDTWENDKYDKVLVKYWTEEKNLNNGEYTINISVPVSSLTQNSLEVYLNGKKSCWMSTTTLYTVEALSPADYDVTPPKLNAEHTEYDWWTFTLTDGEGSGPKEADFSVLDEEYHIDETDDYSVKVPATLMEKAFCMSGLEKRCIIEYTGCDNAGNDVISTRAYIDNTNCNGPKVSKNGNTGIYIWDGTFYDDTYPYMNTVTYYITESNDGNWKEHETKNKFFDRQVKDGGWVVGYDYYCYVDNFPEKSYAKVVNYAPNYRYPYPKYVYLGNESSGNYDILIQNGSSKNSVVICSDQPVLVHTMVTDCPLEVCKDWDYYTWEYYKKEVGIKYLKFSPDVTENETTTIGDHFPKVYNIPINNNQIAEGECYCVIAHYANGSVLMSEVFQK